jgi:pantothenate kinase
MLTLADFDEHVPLMAGIAASPGRLLVAVAGPPGAGKSSFAQSLTQALNSAEKNSAAVIPMDGFHYDDAVLEARGLLGRKGAPATFDFGDLRHMLVRLRASNEAEVAVPVFDRVLEISRAGALIIPVSARVIVVEGNYLLLNQEPWRDLRPLFDITVMVRESRSCVEARLFRRWLSYGFSEAEARMKVYSNDLPNADLVLEKSIEPDFGIKSNLGPS